MLETGVRNLQRLKLFPMACIPNSPSNELNIFTDSNEKKTCMPLSPLYIFKFQTFNSRILLYVEANPV